MQKSGVRWLVTLVSTGLLACGSDTDENRGVGGDPSTEDDGGTSGAADAADVTGDASSQPTSGDGAVSGARDGSGGPASGCAVASAAVELQPVHLAFAFDVSGSMGMNDKPWHNKALKWDPVVSATRAFFEAETSAGLTASLTFFPTKRVDEVCSAEAYFTPDVPMTGLPSSVFGEQIDLIPPGPGETWGQSTPTLAIVRGSRRFVADYREGHEGRYAIVLVTDGYPQNCSRAADSVDAVVNEAQAALADDLPTYVIGVANPMVPNAPDTVSDLHRIAEAGGTESAFLIDTGDAAATASTFSAAIAQIQKAAVSCSVAIPSTGEFDKRNVAVHYEVGGDVRALTYDKDCNTASAWHYDNVDDPTQIVLCPATCTEVGAIPDAALEVEFACEPQLFL